MRCCFDAAIIVGVITARWVTKPILSLNDAAKNIAQGEWGESVIINRDDEVGELAHLVVWRRNYKYPSQECKL